MNNEELNGTTLGSTNEEVIETLEVLDTLPQSDTTEVLEETQQVNTVNTVNTVNNSMPGFESSEVIGTTPPIDINIKKDNKPKKEKGAGSKIIFVMIILILLFGVGFGTYYILNYTDLLNRKPKVSVTANTVTINLNNTLSNNITDYATIEGTNTSNCSLDTSNVDTTKEGNYKYKVVCGDITKEGYVYVVNNTKYELVTKHVYITKGENVNIKDFIDNYDESVTYVYDNEETVKGYLAGEAGDYKILIKATDKNKNSSLKEANLTILEYKIKGYLTCSKDAESLESENATLTTSSILGIADNSEFSFNNIYKVSSTFKFSDEAKYKENYEKHKNGELTINGIATKNKDVKFSDEDHTIIVVEEKTKSDLISVVGEDNAKTYGTLKNYYEQTLGYKCSYNNK